MGLISEQPLYIRVDASAEIGIGHFMRCFALAQFWRDQGGEVTFAGVLPAPLQQHLDVENVSFTEITDPYPDPRDLTQLERLIPRPALVIIDGYQFDADYCAALSSRHGVLVIDDYGHRPAYAGDILLNQNCGADGISYGPTPRVRLFGTRYALIGRRFRMLRPKSVNGKISRVLVTFGGADPNNVTLDVLQTLADSPLRDAAIRVVVGPTNPNSESLAAFAADHGAVTIFSGDFDMAGLMAESDLAIGAAGSTCLELAYLGVSMVITPIAENQLAINAALVAQGAALGLDPSPPLDRAALAAIIESLLAFPESVTALSDNAKALVDGEGVRRVTDALCQLTKK